MDIDIARWILEFLLRQPGLDNRTINSVIRVLPLDDSNFSLKKGILLKKIESEISGGVVSEEILVFLEQIEELDHREGIKTLESMKKAYCEVAVECTVRFLEGGEADMEEKYFDAVKRIWRVRVSGMEKFEMGVGLVSKGLKEWRDTIAAGVWDSSVHKDVLVMSRGVNALEAVRNYVDEARERMGPSFLEVMAETLTDDTVREALGWGIDGIRDQGREFAPSVEKDVVTDGVCDEGRESAPGVPNAGENAVTDKGDKDLPFGHKERPKIRGQISRMKRWEHVLALRVRQIVYHLIGRFLRGDQYAIALALLDEGKVVLGVLACPNLPLASAGHPDDKGGCLFSAHVHQGTYMESLNGSSPVKVHVSATENPEEASFFESYEAAHSLHDLSSSIAKKLGVKAPPVRIDSQAKYGALSRGDGAIYLRFPHKGYREKIWDHAAGYIVVAEAGGVVTDAGGNPLDFSKGRYLDLDTGIIVTNQKLMPSLLKAVRESLDNQAQL